MWIHEISVVCNKDHKQNITWVETTSDKLTQVVDGCIRCNKFHIPLTVKKYLKEPYDVVTSRD